MNSENSSPSNVLLLLCLFLLICEMQREQKKRNAKIVLISFIDLLKINH